MKSEILVHINDKPIRFKFGVNTAVLFQKKYSFDDFTTLGVIVSLFWCGVMVRSEANGLPNDFSNEDMGDLIDEMDQKDFEAIKALAFECLGFIKETSLQVMENLPK